MSKMIEELESRRLMTITVTGGPAGGNPTQPSSYQIVSDGLTGGETVNVYIDNANNVMYTNWGEYSPVDHSNTGWHYEAFYAPYEIGYVQVIMSNTVATADHINTDNEQLNVNNSESGVEIWAGMGNDQIEVYNGAYIRGQDGSDTMYVHDTDEGGLTTYRGTYAEGDAGSDYIHMVGNRQQVIAIGDAGNDVLDLYGCTESVYMQGGTGSDLLREGSGAFNSIEGASGFGPNDGPLPGDFDTLVQQQPYHNYVHNIDRVIT
jgi:hypothetical protein